jgi:hypothetical protein
MFSATTLAGAACVPGDGDIDGIRLETESTAGELFTASPDDGTLASPSPDPATVSIVRMRAGAEPRARTGNC